ncbi:MAG: lipopolysaccharide biosynthesis protein [Treponema sp.]|nr:lipopolysaccharide biosynthesis protein [Treponema sp.]
MKVETSVTELNIKQKTVSGFFWRLSERLCAQVVTFAVTVVLARILMPEDYGVVAIVNVFVAVADGFVTGGIATSLIQKNNADETDYSSMFYISFLFSFFLYVVLFFCCPLIARLYRNELLIPIFRVMGIKFFISAVNSVQQAYVARRMIFKKFFFATIIGTVVSGALGVLLALSGKGIWALVTQSLMNPFIDTIILFITVRWHPRLLFSFARAKLLFQYGWKLALTRFIGTFFEKLRQCVVGIKYSANDLAFYNRGEALPSLVAGNVISTLESVLFPALSNFQNDREKLKMAIRHAVKLGSYVLSPVLVGLALVSDKIVFILYGKKWAMASPFVALLSLSMIPSVISSINVQAIKALGRSDVILMLEFIKKPFFIAVVFFCIFISPIAMAYGAIVYGLVSCMVNYFPNIKLLGYVASEQFFDFFPPVVLSFFMSIPVYFVGKLPLNIYIIFFLQFLCGTSCYILLSVILKIQSFYEVKEIIKNKLIRTHTSIEERQ